MTNVKYDKFNIGTIKKKKKLERSNIKTTCEEKKKKCT